MAYSDLLIWQYKGKARAVQTAQLFDSLVEPTWNGLASLTETYDIDNATGVSLDIIGRIVGISRVLSASTPRNFFGFESNPYAGPFTRGQRLGGKWYRYGGAIADSSLANDDEMRTLIRLKVIKNYQSGTIPNLMQALQVLLGGSFANAIDNLDMTVTIFAIKSRVTPFVQFVFDKMDLLPRASGVQLLINTDYDFDPTVMATIHRLVNIALPDALQRITDHANG
jgi:Protein of unknown function (DUF2612)